MVLDWKNEYSSSSFKIQYLFNHIFYGPCSLSFLYVFDASFSFIYFVYFAWNLFPIEIFLFVKNSKNFLWLVSFNLSISSEFLERLCFFFSFYRLWWTVGKIKYFSCSDIESYYFYLLSDLYEYLLGSFFFIYLPCKFSSDDLDFRCFSYSAILWISSDSARYWSLVVISCGIYFLSTWVPSLFIDLIIKGVLFSFWEDDSSYWDDRSRMKRMGLGEHRISVFYSSHSILIRIVYSD